jgi:hypothetical protein
MRKQANDLWDIVYENNEKIPAKKNLPYERMDVSVILYILNSFDPLVSVSSCF